MTERPAHGCCRKVQVFAHRRGRKTHVFFCTLTWLKGPHTGGAERPKFFTLKTEDPHIGVAERYKFFPSLNILKGPHIGGSKRPKFRFTLI